MAYQACEDCGTKMYGGFCPNCNEEVFIAQQYREEGIPIPASLSAKVYEHVNNPALPWRK